jgi:uncharacterized protein YwgA
MRPEAYVSALASILGLVASGFIGYLNLKVRADVSEWKNDAYQTRDKDRDELKAWINGSFMRSKEVAVVMDSYNRRLDSIERRIEDVRRELNHKL